VEQGIDDVGFVEAILADLEQTIVVDQKRVYATGMSNGAILAYRLACELADRIAAIGPVAATQNIDDCKPEDQVSVIHFHGTEDRSVPYEGGIGPNSIAGVPFAPVKDSIEFWIDHNGCSSEPERQQFGSIRHERFSHCEGQAAVELYSVIGGGHAWPGGMPGREGAAVPTQEISASEIMWEFFEAHPKP
jgi:polyhydroxybutyrate depolymerase